MISGTSFDSCVSDSPQSLSAEGLFLTGVKALIGVSIPTPLATKVGGDPPGMLCESTLMNRWRPEVSVGVTS